MNKKRRWGWPAIAGLAFVGFAVAAVGGYAVWLSFPQRATATELQRAQNVPGVSFRETGRAVVLAPAQPKAALLMYPGARIDAAAYAYKMSAIAEKGIAVVIAKPFLNFAILDTTSPGAYRQEVPIANEWYVAGHSLGGVKACAVAAAEPQQYRGVVLFGSYCSANIAQLNLRVLSIGGGNDKLSTPAEITANASLLPSSAVFKTIGGMNHAAFGDYGVQDGDGEMSANNEQVRSEIADAVARMIGVE